MRNRVILALVAALCMAVFPGGSAYASKKNASQARQFFKQIPKDQKILQALNRLTFGPRPGDAQQVKAMGLKKWIDLQLHPERIPENPVLEAKLTPLDTLNMSGSEMVRNYPTPQMVRQMVQGQLPFPSDPDRKRMIQKLVARAEKKQGDGADISNPPDAPGLRDLVTAEQARALRSGGPRQRLEAFEAL